MDPQMIQRLVAAGQLDPQTAQALQAKLGGIPASVQGSDPAQASAGPMPPSYPPSQLQAPQVQPSVAPSGGDSAAPMPQGLVAQDPDEELINRLVDESYGQGQGLA